MAESESNLREGEGDFYEVEKILEKRKFGNVFKYKIKWKGWDRPQDLTWQPIENLDHILDLIDEFDRGGTDMRKISKRKMISKGEKSKKQEQRKIKRKSEKNYSLSSEESEDNISKSSNLIPQKPENIDQGSIQFQYHLPKRKEKAPGKGEEESWSMEDEAQSQKFIKEEDLVIDEINKIMVKGDELLYDVDVLNRKGQCVGVKLYDSTTIRKHIPLKMVEFLEDYLIQAAQQNYH